MSLKQRVVQVLAIMAGLGAMPDAVLADRALPPEQREQIRQQMREHWQHMPPEQRAQPARESGERWQPMPRDERQRLREEIRDQQGDYGGHHGRHDRR